MNWYKSESTERPLEEDAESSAAYNYVRRNIVEAERTFGDEAITVYEYEEMKVPKESWDMYRQLQMTQEAVDFLLMGGM